jgi:hypothetical protein
MNEEGLSEKCAQVRICKKSFEASHRPSGISGHSIADCLARPVLVQPVFPLLSNGNESVTPRTPETI